MELDFSKNIVLSLSDLADILRKNSVKIFLMYCAVGTLFLLVELSKEPLYEGRGSYQLTSQEISSFIPSLPSSSSGSPSVNLSFQLSSNPVLKKTVEKLGLQAEIAQKKSSLFCRMWKNLLAWKASIRFKKSAPAYPLFMEKSATHYFSDLVYINECTSTTLKITFLDETLYEVRKGNLLLGKAVIGSPFFFDEGHFTLLGKPAATFLVSISPLSFAIEKLRKGIKVREKKYDSLQIFSLSYLHPHSHYAPLLVNTLLAACEEYLREQSAARLDQQLAFLNQRKEAALAQYNTILEEGGTMLSETDHALLVQLNGTCQQQIIATLLEMQQFTLRQCKERVSLHEIVSYLEKANLPAVAEGITLERAKKALSSYESKLENLYLLQEQCDLAIDALCLQGVNSAVTLPFAKELNLDLTEILDINQKLADVANWSLKEREQLQEELAAQTSHLVNCLRLTKEGYILEERGLKERIDSLEKSYLSLLLSQYYSLKQSLFPLPKQVEQLEHLSHLADLVETKSIAENLAKLDIYPYEWAIRCAYPMPPRLALAGLGGGFVAALGMILFLCFREVRKGPTASSANMKAAGKSVGASVGAVANCIQGKRLGLICSKNYPYFALELKRVLERRGKTVCLLDNLTEQQLFSENFSRNADHILLLLKADPSEPAVAYLSSKADFTIYLVTDERMQQLLTLSPDTIFLYEEKNRVPLKVIEPILRSIFSSSSKSPLTQDSF